MECPLRPHLVCAEFIRGSAKHDAVGLRPEIVHRGDSRYDRRERGGNLRIAIVGVMLFSLDEVGVDFRVEGPADLPGVAGEFNGCFAPADTRYGKAMRLEPCDHPRDIRLSRAVQLAELLRREPLVIAAAARSVGILNKLAKRGLPRGRALKEQKHAFSWKRINNRTLIVAGLGQRMYVASEGDALAVIDGLLWGGDGRRWPERYAARDGSDSRQETK